MKNKKLISYSVIGGIRWFYNPNTGTYTWRAGGGNPGEDYEEIDTGGSGSSSSGSSGTCRATGNAQCPS